MGYIINIGTANPETSLSQDEFYTIYSELTQDANEKRKLKFLTARSEINQRYCVEPNLIPLANLSLEKKLELYHNQALQLASEAVLTNPSYNQYKESITDIIFISCTGLQAPGVEIDLIQKLGLSPSIRRYNINFMGCYAALTGMRMANEICSTTDRNVLIVSVELCSLHFQPKFDDDYLLSNSLFADGAASLIVSSNETNAIAKIEDFESRLIPDSKNDMSWKISKDGFLMTLSSEVPSKIKDSLQAKPLFNKDPKQTNWAIHPGGKQIVNGIKECLNLDESEVSHSRSVLRDYGNMSSATLLFVLQKSLQHKSDKSELIACAFGPGLTLESCLLSDV